MKWEEALYRCKILATRQDRDNWEIGEIADSVETIYGDKTLERLAELSGLNYNTMRNCRTMYRAWMNKQKPRNTSVAMALARHPDREYIVAKEPHMSQKEAILTMQLWRERTSAGRYRDMVVHKLVKELCQKFNSVLIRNSKEYDLIKELARYKETDFEYIFKVISSMSDLRARLDDAIKVINNPHHDHD
jgi:hypothetical protein